MKIQLKAPNQSKMASLAPRFSYTLGHIFSNTRAIVSSTYFRKTVIFNSMKPLLVAKDTTDTAGTTQVAATTVSKSVHRGEL